ncbi:MAG: tRNA pseudouridine(38-40) synthase TruA [Deltaproteobacteria bacterium]|nr:tRNA pseudouridine(38-40) synthase TruA [Deltaproteobacteria bacterium]
MDSKLATSYKNIMLILEYDGTGYHGWQRQRLEPTIQGVLEDRIQMMVHEPITLIGSGRTDAGVHAKHQVCHFLTHTHIDPESLRNGLNALTPDDILIRKADYVPLDFHSRYSVKSKVYEYQIWIRHEPNVFRRNFVWHVRQVLDVETMRQCVSLLVGRHDFSTFRSSGSGNMDPVREMIHAEIRGPEDGILTFIFEADGFLRHMIRNIVGTVVDVGRGRMGLVEFRDIFQAKDRACAGFKAPAQGLFLNMVKY